MHRPLGAGWEGREKRARWCFGSIGILTGSSSGAPSLGLPRGRDSLLLSGWVPLVRGLEPLLPCPGGSCGQTTPAPPLRGSRPVPGTDGSLARGITCSASPRRWSDSPHAQSSPCWCQRLDSPHSRALHSSSSVLSGGREVLYNALVSLPLSPASFCPLSYFPLWGFSRPCCEKVSSPGHRAHPPDLVLCGLRLQVQLLETWGGGIMLPWCEPRAFLLVKASQHQCPPELWGCTKGTRSSPRA